MRIVFVYEHLFAPFDEGIKIFANQLYQQYQSEHDVTLVRYFKRLPNWLNSLLLVPRLLIVRLFKRPERLIFIPQAALTFSSMLKLFILQLFYGRTLVAVGVQKRTYKHWQSLLLGRLDYPGIHVLSNAMAVPLNAINIECTILNVGIDRETYQPSSHPGALRDKYSVARDKRVLLHVGHIRESRNIHWLLEIKSRMPELEVLLVGSTATQQDNALLAQLEHTGVRVMRDYLPDIHEIYQLADVYCFPVTQVTAAMETPLSVLEAMATNIPVLTTPFGRLPEQFDDTPCYRYVNSPEDIIDALSSDFGDTCDNRERTVDYAWSASAEKLLA